MAEERAAEGVSVQRSLLLEVLVVGVLVAFGVHLLGSGVFEILKGHPKTSFALGAGCEAIAILYLGWRALLRLNTSAKLSGLFLTGDENEIIEIPRYVFSEELGRFVAGLCAENPAIAKLWQTPLSRWAAAANGTDEGRESQSHQLLIEAVEYFILNRLSLHLSSHFENNEKVSDDELVSLSATDMPGVLLKNRYLSTFSRNMEERVAFMDSNENPPTGEVVFATSEDGAIYDAFELTLPRGTSVERTGSGSLKIKTKRFSLSVRVDFGGFSSHVDNEMAAFYIRRKPFSFHTYKVGLDLSLKLKAIYMFSPTGWEYYRWRETFMDEMDRCFSFERFKQDIGWETARTFAILKSVLKAQTTEVQDEISSKPRVSIVKMPMDS